MSKNHFIFNTVVFIVAIYTGHRKNPQKRKPAGKGHMIDFFEII